MVSEMTDEQLVHYSLGMYKNYIMTGNVNMAVIDAKNVGEPYKCWEELEENQRKFITRLERLQKSILL